MQYTFHRVAPSGQQVEAAWSGERLSGEVVGVRFVGGSYGRAFQIGTAGFHDFAAEQHLSDGTRRHLRVRGRELRVATSGDARTTVATLIGPRHELMTVFAGPAPTDHVLAGLFGALQVSDSTDGMVVRPGKHTLLQSYNEHVLLVAESHSALDVPAPGHAAALRPRSRGAASRHGEVWRRPIHAGRRTQQPHDYSYIVGTPRGIGEAMPGPSAKIGSQQLLDWVDSIDINWHAA